MEAERTDAIKRAFGDRVREVRLSRGVSQERLALLSGINRVYMGRIERGKQSVGLVNICKIAEALNVPPATLLEWPESGLPDDPGQGPGENEWISGKSSAS